MIDLELMGAIAKGVRQVDFPDGSEAACELDQIVAELGSDVPLSNLQAAIEVLGFVSTACKFFDSVKSLRPLTEAEVDLGSRLSVLLQQASSIVSR